MAHFDRFDICEAYYVFANERNLHVDGDILRRLERIEFRPRLTLRNGAGPKALNENAREIYNNLWSSR